MSCYIQVVKPKAGNSRSYMCLLKDGLQNFPNNSRIFTRDNGDRNVKFGISQSLTFLKGLGKAMNQFFRCFCINRFGLGPLHDLLSCSDFGFGFTEIFVLENRLLASVMAGSRQDCLQYPFFSNLKIN